MSDIDEIPKNIVVLSEAEWKIFRELLENPPPPSPELIRLMREKEKSPMDSDNFGQNLLKVAFVVALISGLIKLIENL